MAKKKKKMPGLNTSSTADISFMLLIFFLVTTSMDTDKGLTRRLPQPPENQEQNAVQINERNIMKVNINSNGAIMASGIRLECTRGDLQRLREMAKDFIAGKPHPGETQGPECSMVNVPGLGPTMCSDKHVISLQSDRGTPYAAYFAVQNELVAAYNELRDEKSKEKFGRPYEALNDDNKGAIREIYPQKISEAEPIDYSKMGH